ncbi:MULTISPECIES: hypothetical protein [Nocardia]|uniref:hypothetical protein n=1 Tax=Nocardia TaxID=1817 RepID=UPI00031DBE77|nr:MULTISPECIES: hypothetical protein [Nocardia]
MSANSLPVRVRDIPSDQAEGLRRVHELAAEATRRRHLLDTAGLSVTDRLAQQQQLDRVDRERGLLEVRVRSTGVPAAWVDVARRLGFSQQPWTPHQILPPPLPATPRRGNRHRVASDTRLLTDMAAVAAVREHLLAHHQIRVDPNSVDEHQFRRNMHTLWQRAVVTATTLGMSTAQRERITATAAARLDERLTLYRDLSLDDLDTLWHTYTGAAFGDTARRKLTKTPERDTTDAALPAPTEWLEQARTRLAATPRTAPADDIVAAVAAAVTDPDPDQGVEPERDHDARLDQFADHQAAIESGPDP